jgi:hypothetical protein
MGFASGVVDADLCSFRPLDILDGKSISTGSS